MPIERIEVAAVVNHDGIAIATDPTCISDRACCSGIDRVSVVGGKVNARMIFVFARDRVDTKALRALDDHRLTNGGDHRYRCCGGCREEREERENECDQQVHPAHTGNLLSKLGLVTA